MKKRLPFFILLALCVTAAPKARLFAQPPHFKAAVIPEHLLPGEPVSVAIAGAGGANLRLSLVSGRGRRLAKAVFWTLSPRVFVEGNIVQIALLTVPSTAKPGNAALRIENGDAVIKEFAITIGDRKFASEEIALNEQNTGIRAVPSALKTQQANRLWTILSRTGREIYTVSAFTSPVPTDTRRTSFFGDRRVYRYSTGKTDTAIHAGIDYGVPTGTTVRACADGKVLLAEYREATGNSVIIEHLPGVYSIYYHMSKLAVKEDSLVEKGRVLGESGATGLATGPHLHWEIRVAGENTDPDICSARPVFDRDALLAKLGGSYAH
ncbi:MAG: M23 family metallopeptidase [Treponema sp.]|jgi:murein DD-endopeptidase MepM/ murein hydrolase activator NlpD|nr:M23 family metallopeptidase [Treponema sp.]